MSFTFIYWLFGYVTEYGYSWVPLTFHLGKGVLPIIAYTGPVHLQQLKGMQRFNLVWERGYHLSIKGIRKGYFFCEKWYWFWKSTRWVRRAELPRTTCFFEYPQGVCLDVTDMNSKLYFREKQGFNGKKPELKRSSDKHEQPKQRTKCVAWWSQCGHHQRYTCIHLSSGRPLAVIEIRVWVELQLSFSYRFGRYFFLVERLVKRVYNLVARKRASSTWSAPWRQLHDVRPDTKSYIQVGKIYGESDFAVR